MRKGNLCKSHTILCVDHALSCSEIGRVLCFIFVKRLFDRSILSIQRTGRKKRIPGCIGFRLCALQRLKSALLFFQFQTIPGLCCLIGGRTLRKSSVQFSLEIRDNIRLRNYICIACAEVRSQSIQLSLQKGALVDNFQVAVGHIVRCRL